MVETDAVIAMEKTKKNLEVVADKEIEDKATVVASASPASGGPVANNSIKRPFVLVGTTTTTKDQQKIQQQGSIANKNNSNEEEGIMMNSRKRKKLRKKYLKKQEATLQFAKRNQFTGSIIVVDDDEPLVRPSSAASANHRDNSNSNSNDNDNDDNDNDNSLVVITNSILPKKGQLNKMKSTTGLKKPPRLIRIYVQPLLVLDLNGILCHRRRRRKINRNNDIDDRSSSNTTCLYRPCIAAIAETPIIPRPHLFDFLTYLDSHFCLAIWTSAKQKTARRLIDVLIPTYISKKFLFVWGQSRCNKSTSTTSKKSNNNNNNNNHQKGKKEAEQQDVEEEEEEVVFLKDLEKVWNEFPMYHPLNTLLIDDSPEKCYQSKRNALHPPPLHGRRRKQQQRHQHQQQSTNAAKTTTATSSEERGDSDNSLVVPDPSHDDDDDTIDDEVNHALQLDFFHKLVDFWESNQIITTWNESGQVQYNNNNNNNNINEHNNNNSNNDDDKKAAATATATTTIWDFLQENATGSMGWRGK